MEAPHRVDRSPGKAETHSFEILKVQNQGTCFKSHRDSKYVLARRFLKNDRGNIQLPAWETLQAFKGPEQSFERLHVLKVGPHIIGLIGGSC